MVHVYSVGYMSHDDSQQRAINRKENPKSAFIGQMVPATAAMSPVGIGGGLAKQALIRGGGAGVSAGFEAGQEYLTEGEVHGSHVAMAAAQGAVFPGLNRVGQKFSDVGSGAVSRLGRTPAAPGAAPPPGAQAPEQDYTRGDLDEANAADVLGNEPAGPFRPDPNAPPAATVEPAGSARNYKKGAAPTEAPPTVTSGDMDPATIAAITDPDSQPIARTTDDLKNDWLDANQRLDDFQGDVQHSLEAQKLQAEIAEIERQLQDRGVQGRDAQPVVDTGMPAAGDPIAMGANDAAPMPAKPLMFDDIPATPSKVQAETGLGYVEAAAEADKRNGVTAAVTPEKPAPEFKGETNPEPTEGQAGAGNYLKARANDFGKPLAVETPAGVKRKGTNPDGTAWEHESPYDYGYFNKTKGADSVGKKKEGIDWARPRADDVEHKGDKHFIIDQRDAATGKFDEHKVFTYYKDEAAARDHYAKGFGDGKGEARLGAITEVPRAELVKWLAKHTTRAPRIPFDKKFAFEASKPENAKGEIKVVQKAREMFKAQGLPEEHLKVFDALTPAEREIAATKFVNSTINKTDKVSSSVATARIRPKAEQVPGTNLSARSKEDAAKKGGALAKAQKAMDDNPPVAGETPAQLRARLTKMVADAGTALTDYKIGKKPASYQLIKHAQQMLKLKKDWQPAKLQEFEANELKLRSGNADDIDDVRATNRIEADIAKSRRSGDDAIASAENDLAVSKDVEDALIEAIDAHKTETAKLIKGPNHELAAKAEAEGRQFADDAVSKTGGSLEERIADARDELDDLLAGRKASAAERGAAERAFEARAKEAFTAKPVKTKADLKQKKPKVIDAADSEILNPGGKKPTEAEAAAARAKELQAARERGKKSIGIIDDNEIKRLNDLMKIAHDHAVERKLDKPAPKVAERAPDPDAEHESMVKKLLDKAVQFGGDEAGSVDFKKMWRDLGGSSSLTPIKTYIAKTSKLAHSDYVRSLSDDLHKNQQAEKVVKVTLGQMLVAAEKDLNPPPSDIAGRVKHNYGPKTFAARQAKYKASMKNIFLAHEQGKLGILTPDERRVYDKHLKPFLDKGKELLTELKALPDGDKIGADVTNHMYRISMNEDHGTFGLAQDGSDPTQPAFHAMTVRANTAKERKFVALERVSDGKRLVISPREGGFTLWQKYKAQSLKHEGFAFVADQPITVGKTDYIMRDAYTPEIEANARGSNDKPQQYYKNAALSTALMYAQLDTMLRSKVELQTVLNSADFKKYATKNPNDPRIEADPKNVWEKTRFPNLEDYYMDPHLRYVFDDYAKSGFDTPQAVRAFSQQITKLLFWMPTAHLANVGVHWVVGRGWDWFTPQGANSLVRDGYTAIRSVMAQDDLYKQMMKDGAGLIYGGVVAEGFVQKSFKRTMEDMHKNPSQWGKIADTLGVTAKWLYDAVYNASKHIMWAGNDMFLVQRVLELERKGHSRKAAIAEAEQDIPNYRVPTTILTEGKAGRWMQQMATTPEIFVFGRYHYGVFNSFAHNLKKVFGKDSTLADRWDGLGKFVVMGILGLMIYPLWDKAIKLFTGNEDAKAHRRGPNAVLSHLSDSATGQADVMKAMRSTTTMAPLASTAIETLVNRDYRGKPIVDFADVRAGFEGNVKRGGRAVEQFAEHKVRGLVSPYAAYSNADKKEIGPAGMVRDTFLDAKNPSARGVRHERLNRVRTERESRARFKQGGAGVGEKAYNKITGGFN